VFHKRVVGQGLPHLYIFYFSLRKYSQYVLPKLLILLLREFLCSQFVTI